MLDGQDEDQAEKRNEWRKFSVNAVIWSLSAITVYEECQLRVIVPRVKIGAALRITAQVAAHKGLKC